MTEEYWRDFDMLINPEIQRFRKSAEQGMSDVAMEASRRGALASSTAMLLTVQVAEKSISQQLRSGFLALTRTMNAHAVPITDDNRIEILRKFKEWADLRIGVMEDVVRASHAFKAVTTSNRFLAPIRNAAGLELQSITGEINLIVAQNANRKAEPDSGPSVVINGPVGQAVIGSGSMGVYVSNVDAKTREALLSAFAEIESQIEDETVAIDAPKEEVRDLIQDARTEIDKPKPNMTKLKSILAGLGSAINYAPKMKAAYDVLKWAASFIGVTLP
jgi:hypothetical protein